ncbi:MAG: Cof-type HAD-IIB family hydrolase [Eubacteriales bacterium]
MIKLIATDLDDTLLNSEGNISSGNIEAIHKAVKKGVKVTIATGRMAACSRRYARKLSLDIPIITYHGALVEQALSGEVLYRKVIPIDLVSEIVSELFEMGIHTHIFIKDRVFTQKENSISLQYGKMVGIKVEETDIMALLEKEPEGLEKIQVIADEQYLREIDEKFRTRYGDRIHITSSKPNLHEMLHKEVNKGLALKVLAEQMGIKREEVLAVGDSPNDIEMIKYAGIGVAVENAWEEVKKIADYITASNINDGVARAIEKFVL